jgi:hypothetical protein
MQLKYSCMRAARLSSTPQQLLCRSIASSAVSSAPRRGGGDVEKIPEELMKFMHGRNKKERTDSVSVKMLENRRDHLTRCAEMDVPMTLLSRLEALGLGTKRRRHNVFSKVTAKALINGTEMEDKLTATAAGGHGVMLTAAAATKPEDWPVFAHILPEVAFAGHSNSGKSTLVNAMVGAAPRLGPASVSDRAVRVCLSHTP